MSRHVCFYHLRMRCKDIACLRESGCNCEQTFTFIIIWNDFDVRGKRKNQQEATTPFSEAVKNKNKNNINNKQQDLTMTPKDQRGRDIVFSLPVFKTTPERS